MENERLQPEQALEMPTLSMVSIAFDVLPMTFPAGAPVAERLVYVPKDQKGPSCRTGMVMGLAEGFNEVWACIWVQQGIV